MRGISACIAASLVCACLCGPAWAQAPEEPPSAAPAPAPSPVLPAPTPEPEPVDGPAPSLEPTGDPDAAPAHGASDEAAPDTARPLPIPEPPVAPDARRVTVSVTRISPDGASAPLPGAEVVVERTLQRPDRRGAENEGYWLATTGADGLAGVTLPQPGPGRQDQAWVVWRGIRFPIAQLRYDERNDVVVWEPTTEDAALTFFVQLELFINEGAITVSAVYQIVNRSLEVVDTDRPEGGLRIPLLLPAVFDAPVDEGLLPPHPDERRARLEHEPAVGRLAVERGALVYRGPVVPGAGVNVSVGYAISYDSRQDYLLALRPPHDIEQLLVSARWSDRTAPRVEPRRAYAPLIRAGVDDRQRMMTIFEPPKAGEPFFVAVDAAPARQPVQNAIALAGLALVGVVFALALFAASGRRRARARLAATVAEPQRGV